MGTIWKADEKIFIEACSVHPKYKALASIIENAIHSGELVNQQKLPAQRLLADSLNITHGTVTRAYELLAKQGLVVAKLGAGTYVNVAQTIQGSAIELKHALVPEPNKINDYYDFASSMQPLLGQQILLKNALAELAKDIASVEEVMNYSPYGLTKHKQIFIDWLATKGMQVSDSEIVFTQGAQQGIYTCLQILTNENDYILHEELAYPGIFRAASASNLNPLAVPITENGLDLELLQELCQKFSPKVLYITPNMQNPTNVKYSQALLEQLVALSHQYQFYIIEDDVNYCLPEDRRTPLQQIAPERVFYLSSLSKYVAGGLRVAYSIVPKDWQQAFNANIHSQCWMVSILNFELASRFIMSENFTYNQSLLADEMRYRQVAFKAMAEKNGLTTRGGGLNVWLQLPDLQQINHINVNQFNAFLLSNKIKVRNAELFRSPVHCASSVNVNCMRISLGGFNARADFDKGLFMFEQALIQFKNQQDVII